MADGSLKFDTKIDTEGFEKGTSYLKDRLKGVVSSLNKSGTEISRTFGGASSSVMRVENSLRSTEEAMKKLEAEMDSFANKRIPTEEYNEIKKQLDDTTAKYNTLQEKQERFIATGGKTDSKTYKNMQYDLEQLKNTIDVVRGELDDLVDRGKAFTLGRDTTKYADMQAKYKDLASKADVYGQRLKELDNQQRKASVSTKKLSNNMKKAARTSIPLTKSILKLSNMFKLMVLRTMIRSVINAVKEGFQNLAQYSNQANKDMSALATSAQTLKNSFAAAFAPILTAITPALQTLINHLSQALTVMGQFFAVLFTGATTFTKAKDAQVDYAKSLGKTAKEANKALSPIDKLNVVTDSETKGSGTPSAKEMFETIDIDPKIASVATTIADTIKASFGNLLTWFTTTFGPAFSNIWAGLQAPIEDFRRIVTGIWTDIQTLWQPFLDYISGYYVPFLQQCFTFIGEIVTGLFDTFNKVFSDIWNLAMYPILQNILTTVLPMLTEFATEFYGLMSDVFEGIKEIFDMLWADVAAPALEFFAKVWTDVANIMRDFWEKWGKPIFDGMREAWQKTADVFKAVWNKVLKPIWDTFMKTVDKLWSKHLKPFLANFMDLIGALVDGALTIYNKFIAPVAKWFIEKFGPPIAKVITYIIGVFGDWLGGIIDVANSVIDALKGVIDFVVGVFTGNWNRAWEGIKKTFKGIWDAMVNIVKTPVNLIIDIINGLISGVVSGVNTVIKAINSISFTIPNWVPGIGGKGIGFNLKTLTAPKIPRLATGTVVPANYGEFLAILGDNKREPEVVSPVSAMKQAFKEAMAEMGGAGTNMMHVTIKLPNGKVLFDEVVRADKEYRKETGKSAFAY